MNSYASINDLISEKISGEWGSDPISGNSVGIIRTTNFTNEGKLNPSNIVQRDIPESKVTTKRLIQGDVIIEKSGGSPNQPVGRVVFFDINDGKIYLCNNFTSILRPSPKVYPKYFFYSLYFLHLSKRTLNYQNKTTGIINLQLDRYINSENIPLPAYEDQKKIVLMLDQADSLRQKRKQAIKLLDDYLKSVFMEMFGDPITNAKQWKITEFSNLCSKIFGGGTPSKSKPEYYDGKIPWVTPKDMKLRFINNSEDHISNDAVINSAVKMIPSNSVLMVIRSGILKSKLPVAINTVDVTVNQDMKAYVINSAIANPYFVLFFFEIAQHYLLSKVRSVTADNIKFDDIKGCPIILPLIELQNKFSEIVCKTELLKQKMLLQSQELDIQFQALMQKSFKSEL